MHVITQTRCSGTAGARTWRSLDKQLEQLGGDGASRMPSRSYPAQAVIQATDSRSEGGLSHAAPILSMALIAAFALAGGATVGSSRCQVRLDIPNYLLREDLSEGLFTFMCRHGIPPP